MMDYGQGCISWQFQPLLDVFGDGSSQSRDGICQSLIDHEMETSRRYHIVTEDPQLHLSSYRSAVYLLETFSENGFKFYACSFAGGVLGGCQSLAQKFGGGFCMAFCGTFCQLETSLGPLNRCLKTRRHIWMGLATGQDHSKLSQSLGVSSDGHIASN